MRNSNIVAPVFCLIVSSFLLGETVCFAENMQNPGISLTRTMEYSIQSYIGIELNSYAMYSIENIKEGTSISPIDSSLLHNISDSFDVIRVVIPGIPIEDIQIRSRDNTDTIFIGLYFTNYAKNKLIKIWSMKVGKQASTHHCKYEDLLKFMKQKGFEILDFPKNNGVSFIDALSKCPYDIGRSYEFEAYFVNIRTGNNANESPCWWLRLFDYPEEISAPPYYDNSSNSIEKGKSAVINMTYNIIIDGISGDILYSDGAGKP